MLNSKTLLIAVIIYTFIPPKPATWSPPAGYEGRNLVWAPPKGFVIPDKPWDPPKGWGEPEKWAPPEKF